MPWHGGYYHLNYGKPLAVVVPPTADAQINYGWGVGGMRIRPIFHQFTRPFPGYGPGSSPGLRAPPVWPSDTSQSGAYYIRGPW